MKKFLLFTFLSLSLFTSCEKEQQDPAGTPTTIKGNVSDHYRNFPIGSFKVKLFKVRYSTPGFFPGGGSYEKEIATGITDENGNYIINFGYYLKNGESYVIVFDDSTPYTTEFINSSAIPVLIEGAQNTLDINAWEPVKIKINLTVVNNHTPPLISGIRYNDSYLFGTNNTYATEPSETFELSTVPNSNVSIDFWYLENYNSSNPIRHGISFPYTTGTTSNPNVLNYTVDCTTF